LVARYLDFLAGAAAGEEPERHFHTILCSVWWFSERSKNYCETITTTKPSWKPTKQALRRNPMTNSIVTDLPVKPFPPSGRNCPVTWTDRMNPSQCLGVRQKPATA